jgi:general secretion pathway protein M
MNDIIQSWKELTAPLRQRWLMLAPREQNALRILAVFFTIVFVVYGVWMPLHKASQKYQQQYDKNRALLQQMQGITPRSQGAASASGSILGVVSGSAAAQGLVLTRIEPEGDGQVRVWMDKSDFNRISGWLAQLAKQGINLKEVQAEKQADGGVSARLVLSR